MKNTDFLKDNLIAHRGYYDLDLNVPENSLAAFKRATRYNYIIELDVHLLQDGNVVVFHDHNLKRACGILKQIECCTYDEIKDYNLFNTNEKIPLLKDVLSLVAGKVPILIEIKSLGLSAKICKRITELLDNYKGNFAIQSFIAFVIYWFKKKRPIYVRGLLASNFKYNKDINSLKKIISKSLVFDILLKTDFISYDVKALPNSYVDKRKNKKLILGWTIKTKEEYDKYIKYCDNLICDNIKKLKFYQN